MKNTKKELIQFLEERGRWFMDYEPNPFEEARMVAYIDNGLTELKKLDVSDETIVEMYDEDGVLKFRVEE